MEKVLLVGAMYHPAGPELLQTQLQVDLVEDLTSEEALGCLTDASAVIMRYPRRLTAQAIASAPNLRVISTSGRGTDAIDIAAATQNGVAVVNNPGWSKAAVAEQTLASIFALTRNICALDSAVRAGNYAIRDEMYQMELEGKTLGIVGLGRIGSVVAQKAGLGLGMHIIAHDPYVSPTMANQAGATLVDDLSTLLREADVVSLHPELNTETNGLIGRKELSLMRRTAFLINTSRGKVVQEDALVSALQQGTIAGAALDVFEPEPPGINNPLFKLSNVVLSPHLGGVTLEAGEALAKSAASQVLHVLAGEKPAHLVNPEVWPPSN